MNSDCIWVTVIVLINSKHLNCEGEDLAFVYTGMALDSRLIFLLLQLYGINRLV